MLPGPRINHAAGCIEIHQEGGHETLAATGEAVDDLDFGIEDLEKGIRHPEGFPDW